MKVLGSIYREGPEAPGLPFPRHRIATFVLLGYAVAVVGTLVVPLAATAARLGRLANVLAAGGHWMLPIALLVLVAPLTLAWLGARFIRGRRTLGASAGPISCIALLPAVIGVLGGALAFRSAASVMHASSGEQALHMAGEATCELTNLFVFGDLVAAACGAVVFVIACGAVASIDVARIAPEHGAFGRRASFAVVICGALWWIALTSLAPAYGHNRHSVLVLSVKVWIIVATLLAALAARSAPALRTWHDAVDARRHAGTLLIAGLFAVVVPCLFERAAFGREEISYFSPVSDGPANAHERRVFLAGLVESGSDTDRAALIHVFFGVLMFALALAPALGRRGATGRFIHPFARNVAPAVVVLVVLGVAALFAKRERASLYATAAAQWDVAVPASITLPNDSGYSGHYRSNQGRLTIDATGAAFASYPTPAYPPERLDLAVDRTVTVGQLLAAIPPYALHDRDPRMANPNTKGHPGYTLFTLIARTVEDSAATDQRLDLGDYAPLVGADIVYRPFMVPERKWPTFRTGDVVTARVLGGKEIEVDLGDGRDKIIVSLDPDAPIDALLPMPAHREGYVVAGVRVVVSSKDTIATFVAALRAVNNALDPFVASSYQGGGYALIVAGSAADVRAETR